MAVEELQRETEKALLERNKRYQVFEITNNLEEIRSISDATCEYASEIYPDLNKIDEWTIVSRIVMEFVKSSFDFLKSKRKKGMSEVYIEIGEFLRFSIEYGTTEGADKDATFNPKIKVLSELTYDNDVKSKNKIKKEAPSLEITNDIEFICKSTKNILQNKFGILMDDWKYIIYLFVAFCRQVKDYLIKNKDNDDIGMIINLGEVMDLCIEKYGDDSDLKYAINFGPGKAIKHDYSKGDDDSENN